jgi:hypothetical protein
MTKYHNRYDKISYDSMTKYHIGMTKYHTTIYIKRNLKEIKKRNLKENIAACKNTPRKCGENFTFRLPEKMFDNIKMILYN